MFFVCFRAFRGRYWRIPRARRAFRATACGEPGTARLWGRLLACTCVYAASAGCSPVGEALGGAATPRGRTVLEISVQNDPETTPKRPHWIPIGFGREARPVARNSGSVVEEPRRLETFRTRQAPRIVSNFLESQRWMQRAADELVTY